MNNQSRFIILIFFVLGIGLGYFIRQPTQNFPAETPVQIIQAPTQPPAPEMADEIAHVETKPPDVLPDKESNETKQETTKAEATVKTKPVTFKKPKEKFTPPKLSMLTTRTQDLNYSACQDQIKRLKKANDSYIPSINIVSTPNLYIEKFWTKKSVILITCNNADRKMTTLVTPNK